MAYNRRSGRFADTAPRCGIATTGVPALSPERSMRRARRVGAELDDSMDQDRTSGTVAGLVSEPGRRA